MISNEDLVSIKINTTRHRKKCHNYTVRHRVHSEKLLAIDNKMTRIWVTTGTICSYCQGAINIFILKIPDHNNKKDSLHEVEKCANCKEPRLRHTEVWNGSKLRMRILNYINYSTWKGQILVSDKTRFVPSSTGIETTPRSDSLVKPGQYKTNSVAATA